jgi:hypothetical protein
MKRKRLQFTVLIFGILYGLLALLGSTLVAPVYTASSSIVIASSLNRAWEELTNFKQYSSWNPYLISVAGELVPGEEISITLVTENFDKPFTTAPTIGSVELHRQFHWKNGFAVPGLYDTRHFFVLEEIGKTETRLIQFEEFRGVLVWLLPEKPKRKLAAEKGFTLMHQALKLRLEEGSFTANTGLAESASDSTHGLSHERD